MQHKFSTPISLTIDSLKKGAPKLTPKWINPHKSNTFQGPCEWYFKFSGSEKVLATCNSDGPMWRFRKTWTAEGVCTENMQWRHDRIAVVWIYMHYLDVVQKKEKNMHTWSASGLQPLETGIAEVVTYPNFLRQHPSIVKIRLWAMPCPDATRGIRVAKGCAVPATFLIDRLEAAVSPPSWKSPNGGFLNGRSPNYGLFYTQMV